MYTEGSKNHPECMPNEVFLCNIISYQEGLDMKEKYGTIRIGVVSYDATGNKMDWYPIFISESEWHKKNQK